MCTHGVAAVAAVTGVTAVTDIPTANSPLEELPIKFQAHRRGFSSKTVMVQITSELLASTPSKCIAIKYPRGL